jgi:hypothetical protein
MSRYLTTASTVLCPHSGSVVGVASQSEATQDGYPLLASTDTFVVQGCPFTNPDGEPEPCLQVVWSSSAALQVGISGGHALDEGSVGTALDADGVPRGTVVVLSL